MKLSSSLLSVKKNPIPNLYLFDKNIGTVLNAVMGNLLRERVEHIRDFPNTWIPSRTEHLNRQVWDFPHTWTPS